MEPITMAYAALAAFQLVTGAQQAEAVKFHADLVRRVSDMNAQYAELHAIRRLLIKLLGIKKQRLLRRM